MKTSLALTLFLTIVFSPLYAQSAEKVMDWSLIETKNQDGSISKSITTPIIHTQGTNNLRNIKLGYHCKQNFFVQSDDIVFAVDDIKCGPYGCKMVQNSLLQFDFHEKIKFDLEVGKSGKIMTLLSGNKALRMAMIRNRVAKIELEEKNFDDKQQIVNFSLMGFTAANKWCNQ